MIRSKLRAPINVTLALTLIAAGTAITAKALHAADDAWQNPVTAPNGKFVLKAVMVEDEDEQPKAAGKAAAEALKKAFGETTPKVVIVSECFEDREYKEEMLSGVCSVLPKEIVLGGATYGSFTQAGCSDFDSVCLLGIGGDGVGVAAALVTDMGTSKLVFEQHQQQIQERLDAAGAKIVDKLSRSANDRLLILIPDAHSPKNQFFVEGAQRVLGKQFPITGGCVNKNAGQTFVYFRGRCYQDSAVALMLSGDFQVALSGRQAKDNDRVISTAGEGAAEALAALNARPLAALAFNCAGRRGKLDNMQDELDAIQKALGKELPLFGCYCAGEMGPLDTSEKKPGVLSGGGGWHVMFTLIGR